MAMGPHIVALRGGLDLISPKWAIKPGSCIAGTNFLAEQEGYRPIDGFERVDGRPVPSAANYWILAFDAGSTAISEGDAITGATSGATATALLDAVVESGGWGGADAAGYLVLAEVSGTFADGENLQVSAATVAVADGAESLNGADTVANDLLWRGLARTLRRNAIAAPAGSGPVRAVFGLGGEIWCIRDNAGATAGIIHMATSSGWAAVSDYGWRLNFTGGSGTPFAEGDTISDDGTGEAVLVRRVVIQSGSFSGSDAVGFVITGTPTGAFTAAGGMTSSGGGTGTVAVVPTVNALPAGGKYQTVTTNFYGARMTERAYGVNGVGRAFEWDGTVFCPIETQPDAALDIPSTIAEFKKHLFLGFEVGAVLNSSIGEPTDFRALTGAAEFTIGSAVTNLVGGTDTVLTITGKSHVAYLAGSSAADFDLKVVSAERGAFAWSGAQVTSAWFIDKTGLRRMTSDNSYGGFRLSTQAPAAQPLFASKAKAGVVPVATYRVQDRDQLRILYSDLSGVSVFLGRKSPEVMPYVYPFQVCVAKKATNSDLYGDVVLAGGEDGFVYALDRGTSFDGAEIEAFLRLARDPIGNHRQNKRFHSAFIESEGADAINFSVAFQLGFGTIESSEERIANATPAGGIWNESNWNEFVWSASDISDVRVPVNGFGPAISYAIIVSVTEEEHPTFQGITTNASPRGLVK